MVNRAIVAVFFKRAVYPLDGLLAVELRLSEWPYNGIFRERQSVATLGVEKGRNEKRNGQARPNPT